MPRQVCLVAGLILAASAGAACWSGCSVLGRLSRRAPDEPTSSPTQGFRLCDAQAILLGRARGILVAANGGLTNEAAPPNSLAAIQAAIDLGLPMVVVDVCQTPDKVCVLDRNHALTQAGSPRHRRPASERQPLRPGGPQGPDAPIPTLSEALALAGGRVLMGLRLRSAELPAVVAVIDKTGLADQVLVIATTADQVRQATPYLQRTPPILIGFEALTQDRLTGIESTPPWPAIVQLGPETFSSTSIARTQAMGARVLVHQRGVLLVRTGAGLAPYHRMGATILLTDWPRQLIREMREINAQDGTSHPTQDATVSRPPASDR